MKMLPCGLLTSLSWRMIVSCFLFNFYFGMFFRTNQMLYIYQQVLFWAWNKFLYKKLKYIMFSLFLINRNAVLNWYVKTRQQPNSHCARITQHQLPHLARRLHQMWKATATTQQQQRTNKKKMIMKRIIN